ncbi:ATP-binding protein, partial [Rhodoblastus sp.]|uniref:ATP-binding protein n=1 Tax=Rhodoblastus sp. TaxID=1962975 RepID=UPI0035B40457
DWTEAWRACGVAPASPQEMRVWRDKAERLIEDREALRRDQARAQEQGAALERIAPGLETLAAACGLDPLPLDAAALARRIAARIDEIAKAQITAREARARLADAPERIARLEERLARLAEEEKTWRDQWRDALAALCLDSDAAFDEARARVTLWRALPRELLDEEEAANRVDAIGRDMAAFEQRLDALLALCARDISSRPTEPAVAQLRGRLAAARQKAALRARAEQALRAAEEQAALAEQAQTATEADLQAFCARHGQSGAVEQIAARLRERAATEAEIKAESERLALVAEGHDEAALSREAADFDPDSARIRLDMIRRQSKEREDRARDIYAAQRASQGDLARLQQSAGAEAAIVAREAARADIAELSRRWAVLKLSALLVGASLERRRGQRQDPLLARAGVLFAALTEGRYSGLGQNFGEDDLLHLIARRADGEALGLAALSEGARDQLYLALRLAFLEDYAARSESPPFVGDDLFASFDEARAAAGIKALAAAGAAIQPILFTHHAHILRIADQVLGPRAQILRLDSAGG